MVRVRSVVVAGLSLSGASAWAMVRARTAARIARKRHGNWRKDSSGALVQMNFVRGVRRRVMVAVRIVRDVKSDAGIAGSLAAGAPPPSARFARSGSAR